MSVPASSSHSLGRISFIKINDACPLRCSHCSIGYGPGVSPTRGLMSEAELRESIHAAATCGYEGVWFVGGEPSLSPRLLEAGIDACHARGLQAGMVTAPVWGKTAAGARKYLQKLPFDLIYLSFDLYHLEELQVAHYDNACAAAVERGIKMALVCCYATMHERLQILRLSHHLKDQLELGIHFSQVIPMGSAQGKIPDDAVVVDDAASLGKLGRSCMARQMPLHSPQSKTVGACCWVSDYPDGPLRFHCGSGEGEGVHRAFQEMSDDPTVRTLEQSGLIGALSEEGANQVAERLRGKAFVNECHLCLELMAPENRDLWDAWVARSADPARVTSDR